MAKQFISLGLRHRTAQRWGIGSEFKNLGNPFASSSSLRLVKPSLWQLAASIFKEFLGPMEVPFHVVTRFLNWRWIVKPKSSKSKRFSFKPTEKTRLKFLAHQATIWVTWPRQPGINQEVEWHLVTNTRSSLSIDRQRCGVLLTSRIENGAKVTSLCFELRLLTE